MFWCCAIAAVRLKMIAEANSMILLSPGDILSPLQDAQYCINREKHQNLKNR